jgi:hypothetical protein
MRRRFAAPESFRSALQILPNGNQTPEAQAPEGGDGE